MNKKLIKKENKPKVISFRVTKEMYDFFREANIYYTKMLRDYMAQLMK
jgi:hypothetical protein